MTAPHGLMFARIEVPDLDASIGWYTYHVGLTLERRGDSWAQMRADVTHHAIELVAAGERTESLTTSVCFDVREPGGLDALRKRVKDAGLGVDDLHERTAELATDGFAVRDPNGLIVELVTDFYEFADPPPVELRPVDLVHPFLSSDRYEATVSFYEDVLGFRPSDYVGDMTVFFRSGDRYHHSLAVRRDDSYYMAHLCFSMKSFDHMMRMRARALYKDVGIPADLVNHSASFSLAFYMLDEAHGPRIELCDGHRVLTPEQHEHTHVARRMPVDPRNIDVWRAAADDWGRL